MKDINFFSPYVGRNKVKFNNKFFLSVIFLVFSLSILGYTLVNQLKINKLESETSGLQASAEDPKTVEQVEAIRAQQEDLERFIIEVEAMRNLKVSVGEKDIIDSAYIDSIIKKKPVDLFLTSLYITGESTSITGMANDRMGVAEFAKGLEEIESLGDIFISNITKEESKTDYNFNIETSLILEEEVEDDGTVEEDDGEAEGEDESEEAGEDE